MKFDVNIIEAKIVVETYINGCQLNNHVQQVAYSTYHGCLTQICFSCKTIRTSIKEHEIAVSTGVKK